MVIVGSAEGLKRVFQTNQRNYVKDLDFSFHPFLPILGTGLVTAQGQLWQQQRLLMAPTLRVDVLDDVVRCCPALKAVCQVSVIAERLASYPVDLCHALVHCAWLLHTSANCEVKLCDANCASTCTSIYKGVVGGFTQLRCIHVLQIGVAKRAADRISVKLDAAKRSGKAIDMEEEFRLLTLQVIGEAVLSLPPEECDRVSATPLALVRAVCNDLFHTRVLLLCMLY